MAALITAAGDIVTAGIAWMGEFITAINATGNELLLLFILVPLVGLGVGLIKRVISV